MPGRYRTNIIRSNGTSTATGDDWKVTAGKEKLMNNNHIDNYII